MMISRILRCAAFIFITLGAQFACAGSRGLNLVFVTIGGHEIYDDNFYNDFVTGNMEGGDEAKNCWEELVDGRDSSKAIEYVARTRRPDGLGPELGRRIWRGDIAAIKKARSILQDKYVTEYFTLDDGFDGLYVFNSNGKTVSMMSIGAHGGTSRKITVSIDYAHPARTAAEFSRAMCEIGGPLMIGFGV
ncbi:MAG TPA: hypothetical protein VF457_11595 [Burkholderiaceae bacterium]